MATLSLDVAVEREAFSLVVKQEISLEGITAVYGPSAAGKTTLLRVIAGLEVADAGRVLLDGEDATDTRRAGAPRGLRVPALRAVLAT